MTLRCIYDYKEMWSKKRNEINKDFRAKKARIGT